jgi:hypothetical protein
MLQISCILTFQKLQFWPEERSPIVECAITKSRDIYASTFWSLTEATFDHVTCAMFICSAAPAVTTT